MGVPSFRVIKDPPFQIIQNYSSTIEGERGVSFSEPQPSYSSSIGFASNAEGYRSVSSEFASHAEGKESNARLRTQHAHAGGAFVASGDAQYTRTLMRTKTKNSTSPLLIDALEDYQVFGRDTSLLINVRVFGSANRENHHYSEHRLLVTTFDDDTATTGTGIDLKMIKEDVSLTRPGWSVKFSVDTSPYPRLVIEATTTGRTECRWLAVLKALEHYRSVKWRSME